MQDVKEQRLQHLGILIHPLKVETLETRKRDRVFSVVEDEIELPAVVHLAILSRVHAPEFPEKFQHAVLSQLPAQTAQRFLLPSIEYAQ